MQTLTRQSALLVQPLVISYLRFSMLRQAKGDTIKRQTEGAEEYCEAVGLTLTDRLDDKGLSGFRGANRNRGNLSIFLDNVKSGKVPAGSMLIVEDLDRLSRQEPEVALELFLSIINAGVTVVTLIDRCEYRRGEMDMSKLMMSVMRICLAHEESAKKSMRLGKAWKTKREDIAKGKVLTSILPDWLKVRDGCVVVDEPEVDIRRRMFQMVLDGLGTHLIAKNLGMRKSYVSKCLHNRQVLGEFQPHKLVYSAEGEKRREPVGKPILGYYPRIVEDKVFNAVQRIMASRKRDTGPASQFVNLFKGLIFSTDKSRMLVINKGTESRRQYVSAAAHDGREDAVTYVALPIAEVERDILGAIALAQNMMPVETGPVRAELAAVELKFAEVASQIGKLQAALATVGNVVAVVESIAKLETEKGILEKRRRELDGEIGNAERVSSGSDADVIRRVLAETEELQFAVKRGCRMAPEVGGFVLTIDDHEGRERLRGHIRQIVRRIELKATKQGHLRTAAWTVTLRDGQKLVGQKQIHTRDAEGMAKLATARELWRQAVRPVLIAKETELSVSQIYRVCADVKREGKWKPANRWVHANPNIATFISR